MKGNRFFKKIDRYLGIPLVFAAGALGKALDFFRKPAPFTLSPGDRVLAVKLSALGDTLLLLPLLKALKRQVGPQGRVMMVATSINQDALEGFPYVDEILLLDFGHFLKNPLALWRFLGRLRRFRPSLSLDFDQWLRVSPLLSFLSGSPVRYGFKTSGQHRHFAYTKTVPNGKGAHEVEQFASVASLAGIDKGSVENYNGFLEREKLFKSETSSVKNQGGPFRIHFHPGCGSYGWQRAWPEGSYGELARRLSQAAPMEIRITGMGLFEEDLVRKVIDQAGAGLKDCSGRLEMARLAGLLREADLVVCGNTGLMHLASGLGRAMVVLNGPADPVKWGPAPPPRSGDPQGPSAGKTRVLSAGLLCSPCTTLGFEYGCPYRSCMESIEVETVLEECLRLLKVPKSAAIER